MHLDRLMWTTLIFRGTTGLFLAMTLAALWHLRWVRRLPSLETLAGPDRPALTAEEWPRCSVVIAARDEESRIEQTIRHLLAQRGVETEFIIVGDRSSDRTAEILHRLAADARFPLAQLPTPVEKLERL